MNLTKTSLIITLLSIVVFSGLMAVNGCKTNEPKAEFKFTGDTIKDGENLVQLHCATCHKLVRPNELTKNIWKFHTLPSMAHYLGIKTYGIEYYKDESTDTTGLTLREWQVIQTYYEKLAPESLAITKAPVPLISDWAGFTLKKPEATNREAFTTIVTFNRNNNKIYTSDGIAEQLFDWNAALGGMHLTAKLPSAATHASFSKDEKGHNLGTFTCIGQLEPMDFPNGRTIHVDLDSKSETLPQTLIGSELARPAQSVSGDFNKDGLLDWVICGTGNKAGRVYLQQQNKDHTYSQFNISDKPGAVQAVTGDFNHDGWTDLMILFGTGDEGLWLFLNDHKGGFTNKNLLRFPPVYGSTSFQLVDMNGDGKLDLIYTCGYNFRDSRIMKPYHGLYIFTNTGDWNFKQSYFYPINGCTKAIASDFNGDGKIDIATIAFFADLQHKPAEGFVYFEQTSPLQFKPHAVPVSQYGRWMSMDVADVNGDGKPDILLGNYSHGFVIQPGLKPFWNDHLPFIMLQNGNK